jgi:hypothetical protein
MRDKLLAPLVVKAFMGIGEDRTLPVLKNPDGPLALAIIDELADVLRRALPHLPDELRSESETALERVGPTSS